MITNKSESIIFFPTSASILHCKIKNSLGSSIHTAFAGRVISDLNPPEDRTTPMPPLATLPLVGLGLAAIGELCSLVQAVIGVAGVIILSLPTFILNHQDINFLFKKSVDTCITGCAMALIYPILGLRSISCTGGW
jgi:hypothetical protein